MACHAIIDFVVECETKLGEKLAVVGDHKDLGAWDEKDALLLETDKAAYPVWSTPRPLLLKLPEGLEEAEVQYKLVVVPGTKDAEPRFEEIAANRRLKVTAKAAGMALTIKATFGEGEKEPIRLPKFSPPSRVADAQAASPSEKMLKIPSGPSVCRVPSGSSVTSGSPVKRVESGSGLQYQMQATADCGKPISIWHDIPLFPLGEEGKATPSLVNFVCEIPKTTRKKFEVNTKGVGNPIKQDTKNGKLREYSKGDIWFNYGCLPRTWEDTEFVHPDVGCPGDGDPLDACEIGMRMFQTGEVRQTKVLGVICMIDEDETDWKLIVIDVEDRWADELHDVDDVERLLPGALDQIREWWRTYKVTDGKPLNKFGLDEKFMPRDYAMEVIVECHHAWKKACDLASKDKSPKKTLSFSKLADLDMETDEVAINTLVGA